MSFRCRQLYKSAKYVPVYEYEEKTLESGQVISEAVNQEDKKLPDPELFSLEAQLKAGIDLEEVNSKVLKPGYIDADSVVRKYTKKKSVENKEVENE